MRILTIILLVIGIFPGLAVATEADIAVDTLLQQTAQHLKTFPEKATLSLAQLQKLESNFSKNQKNKYYLLQASSLSFRGKYKEQVALVTSIIETVEDLDIRAELLYYLSIGYASLGKYESALIVMNEGIVFLPKLNEEESKVRTLQAAITLLNSLHAYDESMRYADRMSAINPGENFGFAKCIGLANKIEINFLQGNSPEVQAMLPETIRDCNEHGRTIISLIVRSLSVVDLLNSRSDVRDLNTGLSLLTEFSKINSTSEYLTQLEEAMARAYLKTHELKLAERHGLLAYQSAKSANLVQLMEKTSETMAKIKRAQGQSDSAMDYFEINLALKKKVLDDQLQKNLAYQRVKFDTQDKANQLALAEQKNKTLQAEKIVQQGKNQNLLLMITLSLILVTILGAWLIRTLRQKNIFKVSSQIDGLTQISNRAYFIESAKQTLKNPANSVSLILFDMDHFKSINDTFGHSTGDWVLRTVCNVVKSQLRPTDLFGRLGGEEFAICLINLSESGVLALAERCRAEVAVIDTKPSGSQFLISASFGIATHGVRGNTSFDDILAAADKALYFSKNGGRNMVSVFQ